MGRVEKTVFISYRRTNLPWALAIYQHLTANGYDAFFDYESIGSGDFEQIILGNIRARAHFLVVLTPSALERCDNAGDWLRREIETALAEKRNVVPLFLESFEFGTPSIEKHLTGKLAELKKYNGIAVPAGFFNEAMNRLRERFLNVAVEAVIHPVSEDVSRAVMQQQIAADNASEVPIRELTAQEWFEKGYKAIGSDEAILSYTEAIRLDPDFAEAYNNRAMCRQEKGDRDGAILDYNEAIRIRSDYAEAYYNRGRARTYIDLATLSANMAEAMTLELFTSGSLLTQLRILLASSKELVKTISKRELIKTIMDFSQAIRLDPDYTMAYYGRANAFWVKGDRDLAIKDYIEVIRMRPDFSEALYKLGILHEAQGDLSTAIKHYTEAIRITPTFAEAYLKRGHAWFKKEDFYSAIGDYEKYLNLDGQDQTAKIRLLEARMRIAK